jgi:hypothetical protein
LKSRDTPPTREEIAQFLQAFQHKVALGQYTILNRPENSTDELLKLKFKPSNRQIVLQNLTVEDYSEGPGTDKDTGNPLWVFGHFYERKKKTIELYIKVHIGKTRAVCVSFHKAKYDMSYPFYSPPQSPQQT